MGTQQCVELATQRLKTGNPGPSLEQHPVLCPQLGSLSVSPFLDAVLGPQGLAFGLILEPDALALAAGSCLIALLCPPSFGCRDPLWAHGDQNGTVEGTGSV